MVTTQHNKVEAKLLPFRRQHFQMHFLKWNVWISLPISLKYVPKVRINKIPALVQIMDWRRSGDKPLSEPMMVSFLIHICVTRPQWVNNATGATTATPRESDRNIDKLCVSVHKEKEGVLLRQGPRFALCLTSSFASKPRRLCHYTLIRPLLILQDRVMHMCVSKLRPTWSKWWLFNYLTANQC